MSSKPLARVLSLQPSAPWNTLVGALIPKIELGDVCGRVWGCYLCIGLGAGGSPAAVAIRNWPIGRDHPVRDVEEEGAVCMKKKSPGGLVEKSFRVFFYFRICIRIRSVVENCRKMLKIRNQFC